MVVGWRSMLTEATIDLCGLGLSAELVPALERVLGAREAGEITVREAELLAGHLVLGDHAMASPVPTWYRRRNMLRALGVQVDLGRGRDVA
jgi:hypothetical protein